MTDLTPPINPPRMGRPPLKVKEVTVRLSERAPERIRKLVGTYGLSGYVREAVDEKLDRDEAEVRAGTRQPAPEAAAGAEPVYPTWDWLVEPDDQSRI